MSRTRTRAAAKVRTDAELWQRLKPSERAVMLCAGTEEPIAARHRVIQSLVAWGLMVPRARGHILTRNGAQLQRYGRGEVNG